MFGLYQNPIRFSIPIDALDNNTKKRRYFYLLCNS
jgi:hypothetical protein